MFRLRVVARLARSCGVRVEHNGKKVRRGGDCAVSPRRGAGSKSPLLVSHTLPPSLSPSLLLVPSSGQLTSSHDPTLKSFLDRKRQLEALPPAPNLGRGLTIFQGLRCEAVLLCEGTGEIGASSDVEWMRGETEWEMGKGKLPEGTKGSCRSTWTPTVRCSVE